jgi:hypothetical protein
LVVSKQLYPGQAGYSQTDEFGDIWVCVETTPWWRKILNFWIGPLLVESKSFGMVLFHVNPNPPELPSDQFVLTLGPKGRGLPKIVPVSEYLELRKFWSQSL